MVCCEAQLGVYEGRGVEEGFIDEDLDLIRLRFSLALFNEAQGRHTVAIVAVVLAIIHMSTVYLPRPPLGCCFFSSLLLVSSTSASPNELGDLADSADDLDPSSRIESAISLGSVACRDRLGVVDMADGLIEDREARLVIYG